MTATDAHAAHPQGVAVAEPGARPRPDDAVARPPASAARRLAADLKAVRAVVLSATAEHRAWIREVGGVLRDARTPDADLPARALACAASGRAVFEPARAALVALDPAPQAAACQEVASAWIEKHLAACDQLEEAARSGATADLRAVHGILADARRDLNAFSARFSALVAALRAHVSASSGRKLGG